MMSVALYLPHLRCGGAEIATLRLAEGLAGRGLSVRLVVHRAARAGESWLSPAVAVSVLGVERTAAAVPALAGWLRRHRPAVLVSGLTHNNCAAIAAARLAGSGTRNVVVEHAPIAPQIHRHGGWRYRLIPAVMPAFYRRAGAVVAVSDGIADELAALGCSGSRLRVIHNPVLPEDWRQRAARPVEESWLHPGQPPVVLAAGRLSAEKDFPTLLRAFALLRGRRPDCRLMILGEGEDRPALEAEAARLGIAGSVRLAGFVPDPLPYMARAAAFALSSRYEGFGNVLVEALACGAPVVSTDCPTGPREILEGGRHGRLVPVGAPDPMAAALLDCLDRPGGSEEGRRRAGRYGVAASVDAFLTLFATLSPEARLHALPGD